MDLESAAPVASRSGQWRRLSSGSVQTADAHAKQSVRDDQQGNIRLAARIATCVFTNTEVDC